MDFNIICEHLQVFCESFMAPAAKRRKVEKVEEIVFDPAARNDYLTGFHKRKQERAQNARDAAVKREKEEKVKERRQV